MNILADSVHELRIESAWTPALIIREPFALSPPSPVASAVGSFFKPRVSVVTSLGPLSSAPYGDPGESRWPEVQGALLIGGALGFIFIAHKLLKGSL